MERPSNLRYTNESQQFISDGDTCFSRVSALQDKEILWGRTTGGGGIGGGGSSGGDGGQNRRHIAHK